MKNPGDVIVNVLFILKKHAPKWKKPVVVHFTGGPNGAYKVLVSTLLSLRTKDETTYGASKRLFLLAQTPAGMLELTPGRIEKAIYPVGFYRVKARNLIRVSRQLIDRFKGRVPDDLDALLTLPGVGRKTANLVVSLAYGKPAICVDTHVHRITNRLGIVQTRNPEETELALRMLAPEDCWSDINELLVAFGQNVCVPISPFCSRCPVKTLCPRLKVVSSR